MRLPRLDDTRRRLILAGEDVNRATFAISHQKRAVLIHRYAGKKVDSVGGSFTWA